MATPLVDVVHFTDPGCPFAYSAEPFRLKLQWIFGDGLRWTTRMVVLAHRGEEYVEKGFTPEVLAGAQATLAERYGMPIDTTQRDRMAGTAPACRAYVAARRHAEPAQAERLLRELRIATFSGSHLDEWSTIHGAARAAGIDPDALERWAAETDTEHELAEDMRLARNPLPSALALGHKLAPAGDGHRYTCPLLEVTAGRDTVAAPGFQPFESYDVALAHLAPGLERRALPADVDDVLAWAPHPLATQEVAALLDLERAEARERLQAAGATEHPLGTDAFWSA
jgi:predicted DsbA family dithiol-disulfide isomerase